MLGVARRLAAISAAIRKNLWSWAGVLIGFRMRSIHQPNRKIAGRHHARGRTCAHGNKRGSKLGTDYSKRKNCMLRNWNTRKVEISIWGSTGFPKLRGK